MGINSFLFFIIILIGWTIYYEKMLWNDDQKYVSRETIGKSWRCQGEMFHVKQEEKEVDVRVKCFAWGKEEKK